jgi:hypothetical protein
MGFFEATPNGGNLTDRRSVGQQQCRHDAARIDGPVGLGVLLLLSEIDRLESDVQPFLGQEYSHPPGIGRGGGVIQPDSVGRHDGPRLI